MLLMEFKSLSPFTFRNSLHLHLSSLFFYRSNLLSTFVSVRLSICTRSSKDRGPSFPAKSGSTGRPYYAFCFMRECAPFSSVGAIPYSQFSVRRYAVMRLWVGAWYLDLPHKSKWSKCCENCFIQSGARGCDVFYTVAYGKRLILSPYPC
jgi:hypothetical protein